MGCGASAQSSARYRALPNMGFDVHWPAPLLKALNNTTIIDAAWLVDMAEKGGVLPRCQDVPQKAKVSLGRVRRWCDPDTLPLVVVSCAWLGPLHPDEQGEQLSRLVSVLAAFAWEAKKIPGCSVGVFWDYASLPQRSMQCGLEDDDRSSEAKELFQMGVDGLHLLFGNPKTHVLRVNLPHQMSGVGLNARPYDMRGWILTEWRMASMAKHRKALLDMSLLGGHELELDDVRQAAKAKRLLPLMPDAFCSMLESGVQEQSITFAKQSDMATVGLIYERCFLEAIGQGEAIMLQAMGLDDGDLTALSQSLTFAYDQGLLVGSLRELDLGKNAIRDAGLEALVGACHALGSLQRLELQDNKVTGSGVEALASRALGGRVLTQLVYLGLEGNQLDGGAVTALADACFTGGALPALKTLDLPYPFEKNAQLLKACEARGIELI